MYQYTRRKDIQDRAARRLQGTIHDIADAMPRLLHLGNLILLGVPDQGRGQLTPTGGAESETQEEVGFAPAGGVRGVEEVSYNLPLGHDSPLCVWQLHLARHAKEALWEGQLEFPAFTLLCRLCLLHSSFILHPSSFPGHSTRS
jgi:hypothetical protein